MSIVKRKIILACLILIVVLAIVFFIRNSAGIPSPKIILEDPQNNQQQDSNLGITRKELAKHNSLGDCWVSYNGKVYDLTSYLPNHPGSAAAIAPYCGTAEEFKVAFEKQHGTSKVSVLMKFGTFIGDFQVVGSLN